MKKSLISLINQIKIAYKHNRNLEIKVVKSKIVTLFLESLKKHGFIHGYATSEIREYYLVFLKNSLEFNRLFSRLKIISSSSRSIFFKSENLLKKYKSFDFFILFTSRGVLISNEVFFFKMGGIVVCSSENYK